MKNKFRLTCLVVGLFVFLEKTTATLVSPPDSLKMPVWIKEMKLSAFLKLAERNVESTYGEKSSWKKRITAVLLRQNIKKEIAKDPAVTVHQYLSTGKKLTTEQIILIILGFYVFIVVICLLANPIPHF